MPYDKLSDLPDAVKDNLPKHGQEIFRAAYNDAWDTYESPEARDGDDSREEVSFKVAWSAVKNVYEKVDGKWVPKND